MARVIEYRALLIECRVLLIECRALLFLIEDGVLRTRARNLSSKCCQHGMLSPVPRCMALLIECRTLLFLIEDDF